MNLLDLYVLKHFLMWCTIINLSILLIWVIGFFFLSDWVYKKHSLIFEMPREKFNMLHYALMTFYELMIFIFNLMPWLAVVYLTSKS